MPKMWPAAGALKPEQAEIILNELEDLNKK